MIKRTLEETLVRAASTFPAILVTGPRQSGKTTLLRHGWGSSHRYVSLENPDTRARAAGDPLGFLRDHAPPVILDEIQYAPQLLSYIKSAIDEDRAPGNWLLTGSQNFPVMQGVSQSLAGRVAVLTLLPLSVGEASGKARGKSSIDDLLALCSGATAAGRSATPPPELSDWLLRGAYPEVRANARVDRDLWCSSYVQTYLERDVRQITNVGDLNAFDRFLRLAAARTGQLLNYSDLARDAGVSPPTAKQWLSILEASGQIYLLRPYFKNHGKRLVKSPKLYFIDTAIASFLMGLHAREPLMSGPLVGAFLETAVVSSWIKAFHHRGEPPALYFWRSHDGLEVDLLIDRGGRLYPIEVKATATVTPHHAENLVRWRALFGKAAMPGLLVANVDGPMAVVPGVRAVPWWYV